MSQHAINSLWNQPTWRDPMEWVDVQDPINQLRSEIDQLRNEVNAKIIGVYLACDPFVSNYLSCFYAQGAKYPEACSHFLRPNDQLEEVCFFENALEDPMRCGSQDHQIVQSLIEQRGDTLFGDFILREGIVSRGRFAFRDRYTDQIIAFFSVNFDRVTSLEEWNRFVPRLQTTFNRIVETLVPQIRKKLQKKSKSLVMPFLGMLDLIEPLSPSELPVTPQNLMEKLLQQAIPPLDAPGRRWCATVHRLGNQGTTLELIASNGDFPNPVKRVFDITKGEGVISWVALRKIAIVIPDMNVSAFKNLSVEYLAGVRSQLAVPIFSHQGLWGTLSIEATDPNVFRRQEVGYLARVASLAATVALQSETQKLRDEYQRTLTAFYAEKQKQFADEKPLTYEQLLQSSAGPIDFLSLSNNP